MGKAQTNNNGSSSLALDDLGNNLKTIVPSKIKLPSGDGASRSVANTLRGTRNRKTMSELQPLPHGWTRIKHPDSGAYYVHEEKGMYTLSNVRDSKICSSIMDAAEILQESLAWKALREDHRTGLNLVLNVRDKVTSYYCVSHGERSVFWLEGFVHGEVEIPCPSNKCKEIVDLSGHCIQGQYWKHCELFPTTFTVTKDVTGELKDIILHAAADRLLVKFSTSPFEKDHLEYMLNLVKEIEEDIREDGGHAAWIIARFMALYNDGTLRSSYGQPDDFFDIEDARPDTAYQRHIALALLAPFFLKSPDIYAEELHSFHENFTHERWSKFVHKVDQSIRDSNLLATVLLSTNVGLLSWSDGGRKGPISAPTAAQIVTYVSIICSVGSIIIGLAIFKQYRAKGADTTLGAVGALRPILKKPFGLESLAIVCSLPYVLLMWGLIAFLAAFGILFYEKTGIQVRIPITLTLFLVVLGLSFCLYAAGPPKKENPKIQKPSLSPA